MKLMANNAQCMISSCAIRETLGFLFTSSYFAQKIA